MERLSQMVIEIPEIQEIDINSLVLFESGKGLQSLGCKDTVVLNVGDID